jgi:hypothetical protein
MEFGQLKLNYTCPSEYLRDGFIGPDGELFEGLSSYYSLAMAFRLRNEGTTRSTVILLAEKLTDLISQALAESEKLEHHPLDKITASKVAKIFDSEIFQQSATLSDLIDAARPQIINWRNLAGFIVHVERISSQLSLIA